MFKHIPWKKGAMKSIIRTGLIIGLFPVLIGLMPAEAQQAKLSIKEMVIEVQPMIIALPGGEAGKKIAKVPIRRARIRNTELRDLNAFYNAVSIERIYEVVDADVSAEIPKNQLKSDIKKKRKRILRKKGKGFFESKSGKISADKEVKIRKVKQSIQALEATESLDSVDEESIEILKDVYIISFKDYVDDKGQVVNINLDATVQAYSALSVVVSATKN